MHKPGQSNKSFTETGKGNTVKKITAKKGAGKAAGSLPRTLFV